MAFFIVFLVVDVLATVVCVLKGRFFSAFFGVGAVVMASILLNWNAAPSTGDSSTDLSNAYGMIILSGVVLFPLSLIVIIGAFRQAKTGTYWGTKQEDLRKPKVDKLVAEAGNHLEGDEQILITVDAHGAWALTLSRLFGRATTEALLRSGRSGVLIATDQRLLFYTKKGTESFPYETISSFEHDTAKSGEDRLKFHSSGNIVLILIYAKNFDEFVAVVKSKMGEA